MTPARHEIDLANWRLAPFSRFSFQNVSEFVPVALMTTGREDGLAAPELRDMALRIAGEETSLSAHLSEASADALVVMRDGAVLCEWHAPHARPERPHIVFSISKSYTGMLAGVAADDGHLDPDAAVADYVALPASSAYAACRVRDLLDMTVDLDFDEEYLDAGGAFDRYRRAILWNPQRPGAVEETSETFLATLPPRGTDHGTRFYYASPNTDMLGLVIERAVGRRFHDYLAERILKPIGMEGSSYVTVDRVGTARAAGQAIIPADWIADMRTNGDCEAWRTGNFAGMFANGRYRSCWYQAGDDHDSFCAVGIHGQWLWIDPVTRIVIAKTSSQAEASDDAMIAREIEALQQVAAAY